MKTPVHELQQLAHKWAQHPTQRRRRFFNALALSEINEQMTDLANEIEAMSDTVANAAMDRTVKMEQLREDQGKLEDLRNRYNALKAAKECQEGESAGRAAENAGNNAPVLNGLFSCAGDFFTAVKNQDPRIQQVAKIKNAATGQNIGTDAEGGFLVPPEYSAELLRVAEGESILHTKVERIPISGNRLIVNKLKDENRKDGQRNGGIQAFWTGEAEQYTASKANFEQDQTDLHKLTGLCYATDEMLEDYTAMAAFLSQAFGEEFGFKLDDAYLNGTGSGMPLGILNAGNTALVKIAKESGQAGKTVTLMNILKMYNAMPAKQRAKAEWYINQDIELLLMQLYFSTGSLSVDGGTGGTSVTQEGGVPIYLPPTGLAGAPYATLLGRPIIPLEQCAAVGSVGDIVFANMGQYRVIEKGGLRADTSIHVKFETGEQAFRFTLRTGGKPKWTKPLTPYKGDTSRSPYVALAAR